MMEKHEHSKRLFVVHLAQTCMTGYQVQMRKLKVNKLIDCSDLHDDGSWLKHSVHGVIDPACYGISNVFSLLNQYLYLCGPSVYYRHTDKSVSILTSMYRSSIQHVLN